MKCKTVKVYKYKKSVQVQKSKSVQEKKCTSVQEYKFTSILVYLKLADKFITPGPRPRLQTANTQKIRHSDCTVG